jgi:hypothetical protein
MRDPIDKARTHHGAFRPPEPVAQLILKVFRICQPTETGVVIRFE